MNPSDRLVIPPIPQRLRCCLLLGLFVLVWPSVVSAWPIYLDPTPHRDSGNAANLQTLVEAQWPNSYSAAEANLGTNATETAIKGGLWRARVHGGVLPPLRSLGQLILSNTSDPWTAGWWVKRRSTSWGTIIDEKYVHLKASEIGIGHKPSTTTYTNTYAWDYISSSSQWEISYRSYWGYPITVWRLFFDPSSCSPSDCFPDLYGSADIAAQNTVAEAWANFNSSWRPEAGTTPTVPCNSGGRSPTYLNATTCYAQIVPDSSMEYLIAADAFANYANQSVLFLSGNFVWSYVASSTQDQLDLESEGAAEWVGTMLAPEGMLLAEFAPELRYDDQETYYADAVSIITDNYQAGEYSNFLKDASDAIIAAADPAHESDTLSLSYLDDYYPGSVEATSDDHIDEANEDYAGDGQRLHGLTQYANRTYGQVVSYGSGEKVLQYWLFYYYNPKTYLGFGAHEGDWEMVQVHLDEYGEPTHASYGQHADGERCDWSHVEKTEDGRPIVYVAEGSHASYFSSGYHFNEGADDWANGDGAIDIPDVIDIGVSPEWLEWPGQFGGSASSPRGPSQGPHQTAWGDPLEWASGIDGCTEEQEERPVVRRSPQGPDIRAHQDHSQAVIEYCIREKMATSADQPWTLLTSVKPNEQRYPPLTVRSVIDGRCGRVVQSLGAGRAPFRVLASVISDDGLRSPTVTVALK